MTIPSFVYWDVDPVIFRIGSYELRWYTLMFMFGFVLGWYIFRWFCRKEKISQKMLDPLLFVLLLGTIVGARLGHCIFYEPEDYFLSWEGFLRIFKVWEGGLASHGGTIALFVAMWFFAKKYGPRYDIDFLWLLDHLAIAVSFVAALIRCGNLFNSEIYGGQTDLPWGFYFPKVLYPDNLPHHPTQLYEALSYLILGIVLILIYKYKRDKLYKGTFIGVFFVILFGMRFLIEFIKNDQVAREADMFLNIGQLLSLPFILLGIWFIIRGFIQKKPMVAVHSQRKKADPTHFAKSLSK